MSLSRFSARTVNFSTSASIMVLGMLLAACGGGGGSQPVLNVTPECTAGGTCTLTQCKAAADQDLKIGTDCNGASAVEIDADFTFRSVTVQKGAVLRFDPNAGKNLTLNASDITIDGRLSFSDSAAPTVQTVSASAITVDSGGTLSALRIGQNSKGNEAIIKLIANGPKGKGLLMVAAGGILNLQGLTGSVPGGKTSWTFLACPAGPPAFNGTAQVLRPIGVKETINQNPITCPADAGTIVLAGDVSNDWRPNDWIVVAGTDFSPDSSEFVQIASSLFDASTKTTTVKLVQALQNYHFGGPDPGLAAPDPADPKAALTDPNCKDAAGNLLPASFCADQSLNYGVDERAEVGLVSRNVKLTSDADVKPTISRQGGQLVVANGATVSMVGVEVEKFGKDQSDGGYAIQIKGTAAAGSVFDSNSVHHSYNHAVVLTDSATGITLQNNVVSRAVGNLFFLPDAGDVKNALYHNLGIGAMMQTFSTDKTTVDLFWSGDNLTNMSSTTTMCAAPGPAGAPLVPCFNGYNGFTVNNNSGTAVTVPSGVWISSLNNKLKGNSIAGCQTFGTGYQYAFGSPTLTDPGTDFQFLNNRVHGCHTGLSNTNAPNGPIFVAQNMNVYSTDNKDIFVEFDGLTATRLRNLGLWLRPSFVVINHARLGENREGASLVSGGGPESSPPGMWSLLENSVVVGETENNPWRFGPCPYSGKGPDGKTSNPYGGKSGCVGGYGEADNGFPEPGWNFFGYMFYDGPARVESMRFVNFNVDLTPVLTKFDATFLAEFSSTHKMPLDTGVSTGNPQTFVYEGDAALGWFQSNVNNYPPTQYVENVTFENSDFRHQIYTQEVNQSLFVDGDKGTVVEDFGGRNLSGKPSSLTGFAVRDAAGQPIANAAGFPKVPISLNNLPFVGVADPTCAGGCPWNSVDECGSKGAQDDKFENRPTSLISAQDYASLEINSVSNTPPQNRNVLIVEKDQIDYGSDVQQYDPAFEGDSVTDLTKCTIGHSCLHLIGRNFTGIYEPKVINGLGYTVRATDTLESYVDLNLVDAGLGKGFAERAVTDAAIAAGSTTLDSATAKFNAKDLGSHVMLTATGGATFLSTIIQIDSANGAEIADKAPADFSAAKATITRSFSIRLGLCYKSKNTGTPLTTDSFKVRLGTKALAAETFNNYLALPGCDCNTMPFGACLLWQMMKCQNLDAAQFPDFQTQCPGMLTDPNGCPSNGPTFSVQSKTLLTPQSISGPTDLPGTLDPGKFYYDATTGFLFIEVEQRVESPQASSPFGSCIAGKDPACPSPISDGTFYSCPGIGCASYSIEVSNSNYDSNNCVAYPAYERAYPRWLNQLHYDGVDHSGPVQKNMVADNLVPNKAVPAPGQAFPHVIDQNDRDGQCQGGAK